LFPGTSSPDDRLMSEVTRWRAPQLSGVLPDVLLAALSGIRRLEILGEKIWTGQAKCSPQYPPSWSCCELMLCRSVQEEVYDGEVVSRLVGRI
jgi:hypothetical protein